MSNVSRTFRAPDGTPWTIEVRLPGASNAMVVFHHPADLGARRDRYNWHIWQGAEARNVTGRLTKAQVLDTLTDDVLERLFRRSMPISAQSQPAVEPA